MHPQDINVYGFGRSLECKLISDQTPSRNSVSLLVARKPSIIFPKTSDFLGTLQELPASPSDSLFPALLCSLPRSKPQIINCFIYFPIIICPYINLITVSFQLDSFQFGVRGPRCAFPQTSLAKKAKEWLVVDVRRRSIISRAAAAAFRIRYMYYVVHNANHIIKTNALMVNKVAIIFATSNNEAV